MKTFWKYYTLSFRKPDLAFRSLLSEDKRFAFALGFICVPAILYTLMYVFLTAAGAAPSTFTPWLNIEKEDYYFYNQLLLAPSLVLCWILTSGFVQILSRYARGVGAFEDTLVLIAASISLSMWPTLIHDLLTSFLSAIGVMNAREHELAMNSPTIWRLILWICMAFYVMLFIFYFSKSIRIAHQLSRRKAGAFAVLAFLLFQIVFLIFNR